MYVFFFLVIFFIKILKNNTRKMLTVSKCAKSDCEDLCVYFKHIMVYTREIKYTAQSQANLLVAMVDIFSHKDIFIFHFYCWPNFKLIRNLRRKMLVIHFQWKNWMGYFTAHSRICEHHWNNVIRSSAVGFQSRWRYSLSFTL